MGGVIQKVTGALGLTADPSTGSAQVQQANALQQRAVRELEKLNIPTIEAQRIVLEEPELVLSTLEEKLGPSAFEEIFGDPRLIEAELDSLAGLQEAGREGFTAEDRARIEALRSQIGADEKARQGMILQQMAARGALDSGAQLAAQLSSSQAATQRASQGGIELAAQQAAARRSALAQAGQMAGQMGARQFQQQAQQAGARDVVSRFNAAVAAGDTSARRQSAQQAATLRNQQEMYNKGLIQQQYQNQLAKATGITGALGNQAQQAMQAGAMQAQAAQQAAAGTRGLLIGGAQAAATYGAADGGVKRSYKYGGIAEHRPEEETFAGEKDIEKVDKKDDDKYERLGKALSGFSKGYEAGEGKKVKATKVRDINPHNVEGMVKSVSKGKSKLDEIRENILKGMNAEHGGVKKGMNYEAGGEGTIIDSGEESYVGDQLEDNINDGEMVLNLDQQDNIADLLQELARYRRGDEAVAEGDATINEDQQDILMAIARDEASPEDLEVSKEIVEPMPEESDDLSELLNNYQDGGIEDFGIPSGISGDPYVDLPNPELNLDSLQGLSPEDLERMGIPSGVSGDPYTNLPNPKLDLSQLNLSQLDLDSLKDLNPEDLQHMGIPSGGDPAEEAMASSEARALKDAALQAEDKKQYNAERVEMPAAQEDDDFLMNTQDLLGQLTGTKPEIPQRRTEAPYESGTSREREAIIEQNKRQAQEGIRLAELRRAERAPIKEVIAPKPSKEPSRKPAEDKKIEKITKKVEVSKDEALKRAKNVDLFVNTLSMIDNALAHYDAANPNAMLTPIQKKHIKSNLEDKLLKARKIADDEKHQERILKIKEDTLKATSQEKLVRRQDRLAGEQRRERGQVARLRKEDRNQVERYTKLAEGSKAFKDSEVLINKVDTVKVLLQDANMHGGQSLAMLGPVVAKGIAGEVGVLTEKDVTRYVQDPSLLGGIRDTLLKLKEGKMSDVSYENLTRLVTIMEVKARDVRTRMYARKAIQLSKNSDLSYEESLELLDPDYNKSSQSIERKDGDTWEDDEYNYRMKDGKIQRQEK